MFAVLALCGLVLAAFCMAMQWSAYYVKAKNRLQGDHSSWKVMEFSKTIFQAWKVMEKDDDVLEFFIKMHKNFCFCKYHPVCRLETGDIFILVSIQKSCVVYFEKICCADRSWKFISLVMEKSWKIIVEKEWSPCVYVVYVCSSCTVWLGFGYLLYGYAVVSLF